MMMDELEERCAVLHVKVSDKVLVTARKGGEAEAAWSLVLDRDATYFQRFRDVMQADLDAGRSITITPLTDLEALAVDEPPDSAVSRVLWGGAIWCGNSFKKDGLARRG